MELFIVPDMTYVFDGTLNLAESIHGVIWKKRKNDIFMD